MDSSLHIRLKCVSVSVYVCFACVLVGVNVCAHVCVLPLLLYSPLISLLLSAVLDSHRLILPPPAALV